MAEEFAALPIYIPTIALGQDVVAFPVRKGDILQQARIQRIEGYLQSLVSGTFSLECRDLHDNSLIATLTWTAPGFSSSGSLDYYLDETDSAFSFMVTSLGIGAQACTLLAFTRMLF